MAKRTQSRGKAVLMVLVLAVSGWVNRDFVAGLFGKGSTSTPTATSLPPGAPVPIPNGLMPVPAAPGGETAASPVTAAEAAGRIADALLPSNLLPDPFLHPATTGDAVPQVTMPAARAASAVTMMLRTDRGATAVVDGRLVAVGDRVAEGTIVAMHADRVVVRADDGKELDLPLQSMGSRRFKRPATPSATAGDPPATAPEPATDNRSDLLQNLQTLIGSNPTPAGATTSPPSPRR
jgi:hypothetical protein